MQNPWSYDPVSPLQNMLVLTLISNITTQQTISQCNKEHLT